MLLFKRGTHLHVIVFFLTCTPYRVVQAVLGRDKPDRLVGVIQPLQMASRVRVEPVSVLSPKAFGDDIPPKLNVHVLMRLLVNRTLPKHNGSTVEIIAARPRKTQNGGCKICMRSYLFGDPSARNTWSTNNEWYVNVRIKSAFFAGV